MISWRFCEVYLECGKMGLFRRGNREKWPRLIAKSRLRIENDQLLGGSVWDRLLARMNGVKPCYF
jgi:hypothetical protein